MCILCNHLKCVHITYFLSLTLYPAHSKTLRSHYDISILTFRQILQASRPRFASLPEQEHQNIKYFNSRVGFEATIYLFYSHTPVPFQHDWLTLTGTYVLPVNWDK